MAISRRVFVKSGGLALFSLGLDPLFLERAAFASYRPLPSSTVLYRPVLVCLFQRGAVDGLNMVVPHGDPIYYRERPRIAVPEKDVVDLDGYFGLHPQLEVAVQVHHVLLGHRDPRHEDTRSEEHT